MDALLNWKHLSMVKCCTPATSCPSEISQNFNDTLGTCFKEAYEVIRKQDVMDTDLFSPNPEMSVNAKQLSIFTNGIFLKESSSCVLATFFKCTENKFRKDTFATSCGTNGSRTRFRLGKVILS